MITVPTNGTSAKSAARAPKTSGEGRPAIMNPRPTRMPCPSAVSPMPMKTARVTSSRCSHRRARRRFSIGSMRTTVRASAGPSRSTKNITNSISMKLTRVPTAPSTTDPPEATIFSSRPRAASTIQPCICARVTPVFCPSQSSGACSHGGSSRSSVAPARRPGR